MATVTVDSDGIEFVCEAGRKARFGGKWLLPCQNPYSEHRHVLVSAWEGEIVELMFCDPHMDELIASGLITDPYVSHENARQLAEHERRRLGWR